MSFTFRKAVKSKAKLRMAIIGPSGGGKTYTALQIARGLGGKCCVIDTEHGSAEKYADLFEFDTLHLESYSPDAYASAIQAAEQAGYEIIIVDSLSHAWVGKGGALELVDNAAARSRSGSSFGAWREVTPLHNRMIDSIVRCKSHIICTMRSKTDYVQERNEKTGKTEIRKVGLAPVQRDGMEYEFDIVCDMDHDHRMVVTKSRVASMADAVIHKPSPDVGVALREWLNSGADPIEEPKPPKLATKEQLHSIKMMADTMGFDQRYFDAIKTRFNVKSSTELTEEQAGQIVSELQTTMTKTTV